MTAIQVHPQLLADCHCLGRLDHCHVLLHKNALLPWFILVPETTVERFARSARGYENRSDERGGADWAVYQDRLGYPKINFAAIGNVVPQLHLHVVGRRAGDACWPAPVWGHLTEASEYLPSQLEAIASLLGQGYGLRRFD